MVKAQVWIKVREFSGVPTKDDFKLVEEEVPALKDGDVLFEATFLTVDPYMRFFPIEAGKPMIGEQVARVTKSKNPDYAVGTEWVCFFGWRSHTVFNPSKQFDNLPKLSGLPKGLDVSKSGGPSFITNQPTVFKLPDLGSLPHSLALGTVGMPGATAYAGLLDNCDPKAGETVLVNGAAGAVGHVVGQVAKIKGCKVIGYAGTDAKVKWLKEELGFDFAFNYKKVNLSESLKEAAPEGVDVHYDNVGGTFSDTVLTQHMKSYSRVVVIGIISSYNATSPPQGSQLYMSILTKQISIRGFMSYSATRARWLEAFADMVKWIKQEKLKYREHITNGFNKMPEVFIGLFSGENTGKAIIKI